MTCSIQMYSIFQNGMGQLLFYYIFTSWVFNEEYFIVHYDDQSPNMAEDIAMAVVISE